MQLVAKNKPRVQCVHKVIPKAMLHSCELTNLIQQIY